MLRLFFPQQTYVCNMQQSTCVSNTRSYTHIIKKGMMPFGFISFLAAQESSASGNVIFFLDEAIFIFKLHLLIVLQAHFNTSAKITHARFCSFVLFSSLESFFSHATAPQIQLPDKGFRLVSHTKILLSRKKPHLSWAPKSIELPKASLCICLLQRSLHSCFAPSFRGTLLNCGLYVT